MISVFEAASSLEAHMILNLLKQEGIEARVEGDYLQGGIGELQAIGLVRVVVDEADQTQALAIIRAWESQQIEPTPMPVTTRTGRLPIFLAGLLLGGLAVFLFNRDEDEPPEGIDYDQDGRLDERWFYSDGLLSRLEVDRNLDGKVDAYYVYDRRGITQSASFDENFDGAYETTVEFLRANPHVQTSDFDGDGRMDYRMKFTAGVLAEVDIFGSQPRFTPRKHQVYEAGRLVSADFDTDGDGEFDVSYEYDAFEEIRRTIPWENSPPP
ncbi:MAG TPA: DUF2007 domain-containing protein [Gammaproteobacteria bacterium]